MRPVTALGEESERTVGAPGGFSLADTCGPVAWAGGRWPNIDWRDGAMLWVGWEGDAVVRRAVRQPDGAGGPLLLSGDADPTADAAWAAAVLGLGRVCPPLRDPVLLRLHARFPGLRPFAYGSVWDGLVTSIVGQSISVASAAVTGTRLAALFASPVTFGDRQFWPLPRPVDLASADPDRVRTSGVTTRRARALVAAGQVALDGGLPSGDALADPGAAAAALRSLPLVGPWTAASTLIWGVGADDAHPSGDVALLRAARGAYGDPTLDLKGLDHLAEGWRPARGWVARLLWADLLGGAPDASRVDSGA